MIPRLSPYVLLQETLWPNEWLILVSCLLLNQTSRKQVEKIFDHFVSLCPTPQACINCDEIQLFETIRSLGFGNRRTALLKKFALKYQDKSSWKHAHELPGIGEYGARAWEIFCRNLIGLEPPKDGALFVYWKWMTLHSANENRL